MAPLTPEDKIDFLMAVIRNTAGNTDIAAVAREVGIKGPAASMRYLGIRRENERRLAEIKGGGSASANGDGEGESTTPNKKKASPAKKKNTPAKTKDTSGGENATPAKKRKRTTKVEAEQEDGENGKEVEGGAKNLESEEF